MRSFLLRYTKSDKSNETSNNDTVSVDLHINLWRLNSSKTYVDFGFMVDDISSIDSICLYTPFQVSNVSDLGGVMVSNKKILESIFNRNCIIDHDNDKGRKYKIISKSKDRSKQKEFTIYTLSKKYVTYDNIKSEDPSIDKGCGVVTINCKDIDDKGSYYFRIRIFPNSTDNFIKLYNGGLLNWLSNLVTSPSLKTTEIIDFRINEFRGVPDSVVEDLSKGVFNIKNIHYFVLRASTDEFLNLYDKEPTSRIFEYEIWDKYIPEKIKSNHDLIAYHFEKKANNKNTVDIGNKEKCPILDIILDIIFRTNKCNKQVEDISSFSVLSEFKYMEGAWYRIIIYILIIIFLSIVSSYIPKWFPVLYHEVISPIVIFLINLHHLLVSCIVTVTSKICDCSYFIG